jgi:hypothetical protein
MTDTTSSSIHELSTLYNATEINSLEVNDSIAPERWLNKFRYLPQNYKRIDNEFGSESTGQSKNIPMFGFEPTTDESEIRHDLDVIEAALRSGDVRLVGLLLASMQWEDRTAEDLIRAIHTSLEAGFHKKAWELAAVAAKRFPDHPEVQKIVNILSPARIVKTNLPSDPDIGADMRWLKEHSEEYRGKWIAIKGGKLLAAESSFTELRAIIGNPKNTGILVTQVY